jgi:hypothetical protein
MPQEVPVRPSKREPFSGLSPKMCTRGAPTMRLTASVVRT